MPETEIDNTTFTIRTDAFEGPLELLLELVERRKLLINDISLASVTDDYLATVARMEALSLPGTANFVALAATLLLLKSKSLLPVLDLSRDEEEAVEGLAERLQLYQTYRNAAFALTKIFGTSYAHERQFVVDTTPLFTPDQYTEADALREAMSRVLAELPVFTEKPKVQIRKVISLEEMMTRLQDRIERQMKLRFSELIGSGAERTTIIVGFLAVLESVKQGTIIVAQTERFEDIEIERESPSTPRYIT